MTTIRNLLTLASVLVLAACSGGDSPTSPVPSTGGSTASSSSHNAGADCQRCHSFSVAGTVYRTDGVTPYPGAIIRVTSGTGGTGAALVSLTADAAGNFYTNAAVSFGSGLYAVATGTTGSTRAKQAAITSGACNRCHVSGSRIVAD